LKFELDSVRHGHLISGYGEGFVSIGERRFSGTLLLTPAMIRTEELPATYGELDLPTLLAVAPPGIDILVIGCGALQCIPDAGMLRGLGERGIGAEVMTTPAACRCYNVLVAEQRAVAALLYVT
jgi:uncharacterized protein